MRPITLVATAIAALSTAALAQVARTPVEPKSEPLANMAPANATANDAMQANAAVANDMPATPDTKTEPATPKR